MYIGHRVKYPLFLSDFDGTSIFSADFSKKNPQISNFMKIRPVGGAKLYHDGRTDMTQLTVALHNCERA